jgi:DNA-directed RNA polymerase specialized sigma24 family protein
MATRPKPVRLSPRKWASIPQPELTAPEPWRWVSSEQLEAAIGQMSPHFAQIVRLQLQGATYAEISRRLRIPTATVAARTFRGRRQLQQMLCPRPTGRP